MLKMTVNFVLVSKASSMYPRGYTCGAFFACGLAGGHFEHPAQSNYVNELRSKLKSQNGPL